MKNPVYEQIQARNMQARLRMLQHAQRVSGNVSQTCRFFGVSRALFYIWKKRFEKNGLAGLRDQPRRPHNIRYRIPPKIVSLKRGVREQADAFGAQVILIEDKASGTQLIQELVGEGVHAIKKYEPTMDKIMRMHSVTSTIENSFVYLPDKAPWLAEYLHELTTFPKAKYDDRADSTSQALDWFKSYSANGVYGLLDFYQKESQKAELAKQAAKVPESMTCPHCNGVMSQRIPNGLRCQQCGEQWSPPGAQPSVRQLNRKDVLERKIGRRF